MLGDAIVEMGRLLVELLNTDGLTQLEKQGAWFALGRLAINRGADMFPLCSLLIESDICRIAIAHLRAIGSAAEWVVSGILIRWP